MTLDHEPRYTAALAIFTALAAALCIGVTASQLLTQGPIRWAIAQPFTWQGCLEALALTGLLAGGCTLNRRWALLWLVALPAAFYLRRHAVDAPLLIDLAYLEIIIGLGAVTRRVFRLSAPLDAHGYLQAFVLGFLVWSLAAWSASALDAGSIKQLRWLTVMLAILAVFGRHTPLALHAWRRMRVQDTVGRFWCGVMATWILVLFARSNVVFGYDSLWYGLRSEYVLDPGKSVFEPLGLVSPVHYFPKLYEVFLLPVSALGDSSVITGVTILMLGLTLLACRVLAQRVGLPERVQWPILAVIATLPALANSALEPKPDVICVLFVLLGAGAALRFVRSRAKADATWLLIYSVLACLAKLTAIPYVGVLVLATAIAAWRERGTCATASVDARSTRLAIAAAVATLGVTAFVTGRTWLMTGMPTIGPDPLFRLWSALGMSLHAPIGTLNWTRPQDWSDVPELIVDWLFRPQRLAHVVVSWVGNVWLWCAALALAAVPLGARTAVPGYSRWPLAALIATGTILALAMRYHVRGSDGNYFLAALLPAILVSAAAAFSRLTRAPRAFAIALACLPAFVLFQAGYSFVSAGWWPGTRTFDLDLTRSWHDTRPLRWIKLEQAGLRRIGEYLKRVPGTPRVVGYVEEPASFWLPARFEYLLTIGYSRSAYVDDPRRFTHFLRDQHIDYLILPNADVKEHATVTTAVRAAAATLAADPNVQRIDDRNYTLLDLSARHARAPTDDAMALAQSAAGAP
ncbi:MAG: hypothetical protein ABI082_13640 [Dokdonella sp.]